MSIHQGFTRGVSCIMGSIIDDRLFDGLPKDRSIREHRVEKRFSS